MKILYIDIETSPVRALTWGAYDQNILHIEEDWRVIGFAYAWGDGKPKAVYPRAWDHWHLSPEHRDDLEKGVIAQAQKLLDQADVVIAHNGDRFDLTKLMTKFIMFGIDPPSPYLTIDTLKMARRTFRFTKNTLDHLGHALGFEGKIQIPMMQLQKAIMYDVDKKAWDAMRKYNIRDIVLLRDCYKEMAPYDRKLPNLGDGDGCHQCGSYDLQKRGIRRMKSGLERQQYQCNDCGAYSSALKNGAIRS